jgi:hypothetical protein
MDMATLLVTTITITVRVMIPDLPTTNVIMVDSSIVKTLTGLLEDTVKFTLLKD